MWYGCSQVICRNTHLHSLKLNHLHNLKLNHLQWKQVNISSRMLWQLPLLVDSSYAGLKLGGISQEKMNGWFCNACKTIFYFVTNELTCISLQQCRWILECGAVCLGGTILGITFQSSTAWKQNGLQLVLSRNVRWRFRGNSVALNYQPEPTISNLANKWKKTGSFVNCKRVNGLRCRSRRYRLRSSVNRCPHKYLKSLCQELVGSHWTCQKAANNENI